MTTSKLSRRITDFVVERTEAIITRFAPGFEIPPFFCGYRVGGSERPNLVFLLAHLHALGIKELAGMPLDKAISKILRGIDGAETQTFYSFFVANALLEFGKFESNPLLADFTEAERENIKAATDTTHIYSKENGLGWWANNYWGVLARCEYLRKELGILQDDSILKMSAAELEKLLFRNPVGFFDDVKEGFGRYDIYTADVHLFCEPLWPMFDAAKLEKNLRAHTQLVEKIAMENGAAFVFGRSIGPMSVCLTIEFLSMSLAHGFAADPARSLGLIEHAFEEFKRGFEDDLIAVHRTGNTEAYRGIYRIMQTSFDCLAKLCYAAEQLHNVPEEGTPKTLLFPDRDELIPFDERNAGVWIFRNPHMAFQFALTGADSADYVPWPRGPGLFENPVGSMMNCGVPRITRGTLEYVVCGLPSRVEKEPNGITITHEGFQCITEGKKTERIGGKRVVRYRVDGDTLLIDESLSFDEIPSGVSYFIPETPRPLDVEFKSDQPFHTDTVAVSGMTEWRSPWGSLENLHQAHFKPVKELRFSCAIHPKLRVHSLPGRWSDYPRGVIDALSLRHVAWSKHSDEDFRPENLPQLERDIEIVHVHWPEHQVGNPFPGEGISEEDLDRYRLDFADALGCSDINVVLAMHNWRPHHWPAERGRKLYEAWARIADGVVHHSKWAMKIALETFPFKPTAKHALIPHGHFGHRMQINRSRAELEADFKLPPCEVRFGLLGRWQAEKQVEMIMAAFAQAAHPGQQLVVTAYNEKTVRPDDPRIIFLPRKQWMPRTEIASHNLICDALVSAHSGDTYFTSGISADAIGLGIPMLVPRWEYFDEVLGNTAFYHENTGDSLDALFRSITREEIEARKVAVRALQPQNEWSLVGEKTLELYRSLGRKRR